MERFWDVPGEIGVRDGEGDDVVHVPEDDEETGCGDGDGGDGEVGEVDEAS